ncbi:hypothetical protein ABIA32_000982 [Streptacidiphilus sp. MAP12-20]|uniref:hypothetical protein n=1 Tax=Streptacidiphilus sp. MAP12-20 TaxID=3156299 RepID=UPI00351409F9
MSTMRTGRQVARVVGIAVAVPVVLGVLLFVTFFAIFVVGPFALLVPIGALVWLIRALSRRSERVFAEWCPDCGGVLSPPVLERVPQADGAAPRLRAVYTCVVLEHRSWRWADAGEPLRPFEGSPRGEGSHR